MGKNTYKAQRKPGLFAYLEQTLHFRNRFLDDLPKRYIPRLLFLFTIGVLYVGNSHFHEKMVRKIDQLEQEVEGLKVDYTTLKADYMFDSKHSEVAKRVVKLGLENAPYPPLKIKRAKR